ncbi:hypothetical protein EV182_008631, partial [Spiromyces aspiralis]
MRGDNPQMADNARHGPSVSAGNADQPKCPVNHATTEKLIPKGTINPLNNMPMDLDRQPHGAPDSGYTKLSAARTIS